MHSLDDTTLEESTFIEEQEGDNPSTDAKDLSRRSIRSLTFHLLYAAEAFDYTTSLDSIVENFNRGFDLSIDPKGEVVTTARAIIDSREELDEQIKPLLVNWRFDRIGMCTKLILRYAVWELLTLPISSKIVINEAVELAKCFAEKDAFKFVNGILDEAVKVIRPDEVVEEVADATE